MIISLYAGGMTLRDIQFHLSSTIGTEVSHETISKIVDEISDEVLSWQRRPLEPLYPVIYLDAMIVKVKDGGHTRNKAAHIAVGVDMAGGSSMFWHLGPAERGCVVLGVGVLGSGQPRRQGRAHRVLRRADRVPPDAIAATWSQATVQTCVVHLIRNSMRFVSYNDRKAVAAALKPIYTAANEDAARTELDAFAASELGKKKSHRGKGFRKGVGAVHPPFWRSRPSFVG